MDEGQEIAKLKKKLKKYADENGFRLNQDEEMLNLVLRGLLKNKKSKGEIYCPCRIVSGDKEKDKDIICPCVFHRGEIELEGHCKCNLFFAD